MREEKYLIDSPNFKGLSNEEKIELIHALLKDVLKGKAQEAEAASKGDVLLPIAIFQGNELSCLEAISKYLHENLDFGFTKIARLLNRSSKTIWTTYSKAHEKMPKPFRLEASKYHIPIAILNERILSVLESIVEFLKEKHELSYKEISVLMNRDNRTIWSTYHKAKEKRKKK